MSEPTFLAPWLAATSVLLATAGALASARPGLLGSTESAAAAVSLGERSRVARPGRRARRRRLVAIDRQVPQLLDLLAAGSRAGLSAELAMRRAAEASADPLGADLGRLFEDADLGARWREDLAIYAAASGSRDLRRTVAVLERTERLGSPLTDASRDLAAAVRQARRSAILERARTAPVKMLFPLVFLILPAFMLLTVVPVLLATVRSIR